MEPYALFTDIDGTLIADSFRIPARNTEAIRKAREMGHRFFLSTGRSCGNIPHDIGEQIEFDGVISGNGTCVHYGGEMLYSDFMDRDIFEEIARYVFTHEDCWGVFEGLRGSYSLTGRTRLPSRTEMPCSEFDELMDLTRDDEIQVVALSKSIDPGFLASLEKRLTAFRFNNYYDFVAPGNNKVNGMMRLLEITGIPVSRTVAFGDSENDREMLLRAKIGVAVANSQPELLKIADYRALLNREGGVGEAIENILLRGEYE